MNILQMKLREVDPNNGRRYFVEVENNIDYNLLFLRRKDAEIYKKGLKLSLSQLNATIKKITIEDGFIVDGK